MIIPILEMLLSGQFVDAKKLAFAQELLSGIPDAGNKHFQICCIHTRTHIHKYIHSCMSFYSIKFESLFYFKLANNACTVCSLY